MNTPEKSEGAALQFAKHQFLANWFHDQGMDPSQSSLSTSENEKEQEEEEVTIVGPSTSRALNFENIDDNNEDQ